jgi:hypothetical protein
VNLIVCVMQWKMVIAQLRQIDKISKTDRVKIWQNSPT